MYIVAPVPWLVVSSSSVSPYQAWSSSSETLSNLPWCTGDLPASPDDPCHGTPCGSHAPEIHLPPWFPRPVRWSGDGMSPTVNQWGALRMNQINLRLDGYTSRGYQSDESLRSFHHAVKISLPEWRNKTNSWRLWPLSTVHVLLRARFPM